MIYRNNKIPNNYNKIAEINDNYVIWVKEDKLVNNKTYDAYVQYFKPNFYYIHLDNYFIKEGINKTYNANYSNNGVYSYITDYDEYFEILTTTLSSGDDYSTNIDYIADYNELHISGFCLIIIILWVFNMISKLWHKGGCFF